MQRLHRPGLAVVAALLLAGCGASARANDPNWKPQHTFGEANPGPTIEPIQPPIPSRSSGASGGPSHPGGSPAPSTKNKTDPAVVATRLSAPTGLALLPDGTALVGERTTGRIVRVQPEPGKPVTTVRTIRGLSTTGGGGLLDLALSPHYAQDSLIFAYLTTAADNRVVAFTLKGPVTTVLSGIPKGTAGNSGRITFGADGDLYVGTGDAGRPNAAANRHVLSGKVLRISDIGEPAPDNPSASSPVFTSGHRAVTGLCVEPQSASMLEVGPGTGAGDVNVLVAGSTYGWPHASTRDHTPVATLPNADRGPGGCAVQDGLLYVTSLDGEALLSAPVAVKGTSVKVGKFRATLVKRYGRLLTVVAAPDGALWLTTSNKDGHGKPIADDERVLRITPSGGGGGSPV